MVSAIQDKSNDRALFTKDRLRLIRREPVTAQGQKLVAAVVDEFAQKGVQGSRISEICRRAGTTDPTFYRYFVGVREAALFVIGEYYWAPLNQRLKHYRQISDDPEKLFEAVVTTLIRSTSDDPARPWLAESKIFQIVVAESRNPVLMPDLVLDEEYVEFLQHLEKIIEEGQRDGIFRPDLRPALVGATLVTSLHGILALNNLPSGNFRFAEDEVRAIASNIVGAQR
jgi:AcrR family transcriptional regulator